jgi:hypothetical protein
MLSELCIGIPNETNEQQLPSYKCGERVNDVANGSMSLKKSAI